MSGCHGDMQAGLLGLVSHVAPVAVSQFVDHLAEQVFHLCLRGLLSTQVLEPAVREVEGGGMAVGRVGHGIAVHLHQASHVGFSAQHRGDDDLILPHLVFPHRLLEILPDILQQFGGIGCEVRHRMGERVDGVVFAFLDMLEVALHTLEVVSGLQGFDAIFLGRRQLVRVVVVEMEGEGLRHGIPMAGTGREKEAGDEDKDMIWSLSSHFIRYLMQSYE